MLPEHIDDLQEALKYHIAEEQYTLKELKQKRQLETLKGQRVTIVTKEGNLTVNGISILTKEIPSRNGIIYLIDSFLLSAVTIEEPVIESKD